MPSLPTSLLNGFGSLLTQSKITPMSSGTRFPTNPIATSAIMPMVIPPLYRPRYGIKRTSCFQPGVRASTARGFDAT